MSRKTQLLVDRAEALIEIDRAHEAVPLLHQALAADPESPYILCWLGYALEQAGDLSRALEAAEAAIAADPEGAWAQRLRGWILFRAGRVLSAIDATRAALEIDPWELDSMLNLSHFLVWIGAGDEALAIAERAVQTHPSSPEGWTARCLSALSLGRLRMAENSARRALSLEASDAILHNNLGWTLALQSRFGNASECFRRALEIDAGDGPAPLNLAFCLRALGRAAEAADLSRATAQSALARIDMRRQRNTVSSNVLSERGWWLLELDREAEARAQLQAALDIARTAGERVQALRWLLHESLVNAREEEAHRLARVLLDEGPDDLTAGEDAALAGWLLGDAELARAGAIVAGQLVDTPEYAARALGYASLAETDWATARDMLSLAIRRNAVQAACCEHVGLACTELHLGDEAAAHDSFVLAMQMMPRCKSVLRFRAVLLPD